MTKLEQYGRYLQGEEALALQSLCEPLTKQEF